MLPVRTSLHSGHFGYSYDPETLDPFCITVILSSVTGSSPKTTPLVGVQVPGLSSSSFELVGK